MLAPTYSSSTWINKKKRLLSLLGSLCSSHLCPGRCCARKTLSGYFKIVWPHLYELQQWQPKTIGWFTSLSKPIANCPSTYPFAQKITDRLPLDTPKIHIQEVWIHKSFNHEMGKTPQEGFLHYELQEYCFTVSAWRFSSYRSMDTHF